MINAVIEGFSGLEVIDSCNCPITANCPITLSDYNFAG